MKSSLILLIRFIFNIRVTESLTFHIEHSVLSNQTQAMGSMLISSSNLRRCDWDQLWCLTRVSASKLVALYRASEKVKIHMVQ
jgi:hypothetical protein